MNSWIFHIQDKQMNQSNLNQNTRLMFGLCVSAIASYIILNSGIFTFI
jgi:hypothetical protein